MINGTVVIIMVIAITLLIVVLAVAALIAGCFHNKKLGTATYLRQQKGVTVTITHKGLVVLCWVWIGIWFVNKVIQISSGNILDALDFSNPSLAGIIAVVCILLLIINSIKKKSAGYSEVKPSIEPLGNIEDKHSVARGITNDLKIGSIEKTTETHVTTVKVFYPTLVALIVSALFFIFSFSADLIEYSSYVKSTPRNVREQRNRNSYVLLDEGSQYLVMDMRTNELVEDTFFFKSTDGSIIKVTPHELTNIAAGSTQRLFKTGVVFILSFLFTFVMLKQTSRRRGRQAKK